MFNLLDSHDTSRILSLCGGNKAKAKLAFLFMFTQVGSPCIYYGDEVAMEGARSMGTEGNRACMEWDESKQDLEFKAFIQSLIQLRKDHPELNQSNIEWLHVADKDCIAYRRGGLAFVLNNSDSNKKVVVGEHHLDLQAYDYAVIR
jgi:glycosidase